MFCYGLFTYLSFKLYIKKNSDGDPVSEEFTWKNPFKKILQFIKDVNFYTLIIQVPVFFIFFTLKAIGYDKYNPRIKWLGLKKIIASIPSSLISTYIVSILILAFIYYLSDDKDKKNDDSKSDDYDDYVYSEEEITEKH